METPQSLKLIVLIAWLEGDSRDHIAEVNGVSQGVISYILKELRKEIPDLDLMRELAVLLSKAHMSLDDLALSVRLKNRLQRLDIQINVAEDIIEQIHLNCFKKNIKIDDFLTTLFKLIDLCLHLQVDFFKLDDIAAEKIEYQKQLDMVSSLKRAEHKEWLIHHGVNESDYQQFLLQRPIFEAYKAEREKNDQKDIIIDDLCKENLRLKQMLDNKNYGQPDYQN